MSINDLFLGWLHFNFVRLVDRGRLMGDLIGFIRIEVGVSALFLYKYFNLETCSGQVLMK